MGWKKVKLGEFLHLYRNEHIIQDDENYRQVTISKNHGISFRGSKAGKNIGRKRQFIIDLKTYPNTVLFTRQGIRDGAIGIAPAEVDGCIVTENMPMMSIDTNLIEVAYLRKLLLSEYLFDKIRLLSVTGSAQKSIHERDLLKIELALPTIEKQRDECKRFNSLDIEHSELKSELTHQQTLLKKLRQQILQEAIEGKLTEEFRIKNCELRKQYEQELAQADDPETIRNLTLKIRNCSESAASLLQRIKEEKEQLIKDKKIKKGKKQSASESYKGKIEVPYEWKFSDLDDITQYITDGTHQTPSYTLSGRKFLSAQNVKPFRFMPENHRFVSEAAYEGYIKNRVVEKGDLLLGRVGAGIGETAVVDVDIECAIYVSLGLVKTFKTHTSSAYLAIVFNSPYGVEYAKGNISSGGGSAGNFNLGRIRAFKIPLPPLAEQKSIVVKVEKLLALCDELETQITSNQTHAEQLMQAVLKEAFQQDSKNHE